MFFGNDVERPAGAFIIRYNRDKKAPDVFSAVFRINQKITAKNIIEQNSKNGKRRTKRITPKK